jgi:hypothetical protein
MRKPTVPSSQWTFPSGKHKKYRYILYKTFVTVAAVPVLLQTAISLAKIQRVSLAAIMRDYQVP